MLGILAHSFLQASRVERARASETEALVRLRARPDATRPVLAKPEGTRWIRC